MPAQFRDAIRTYVPAWLSDRVQLAKTVGFRVLWALCAPLDAAAEHALQGLQSRWPGVGTTTALPLIGSDRKLHRGIEDTDADYAERLTRYLDLWGRAGSAEAIARALHDYMPTRPKVRVVSRGDHWVTVDTDGSVTEGDYPGLWDWDSNSHPDRAEKWADIWIVIYLTPGSYEGLPPWGSGGVLWGQDPSFGCTAPQNQALLIRSIVNEWKAAHTQVRGIMLTYNPDDFNPDDPLSGEMPDGWWGGYHRLVSGTWVLSRSADVLYIDPEGAL